MTKTFNYNDGGRSKYFKAVNVNDCVTRAIAIATNKDYKEVYDIVNKEARKHRNGGNARNGINSKVVRNIISIFGGIWHSTMDIGIGCVVHLRADELPSGRIICRCSGHDVAVIDGVLNDTYDCSRGGRRCVYGYWTFNK